MPHFVGVQGALGAGKTLNAALMAQVWSEATGGRAKIFSNFEMRNSTLFDSHKKWFEVADALGSIIVWDESEIQFDRRQWNTNVLSTQIFNYLRKLRSVNIFVCPYIDALDSRILKLLEVLINVRKREGVGIWLDFFEFQDKRFGPNGRYIKTKFLPWKNFKKIIRLNLYDTYQMVYPFTLPNTERGMLEFLKELEHTHRLALERERKGLTINQEELTDGWYTTSTLKRDKEIESDESALFIPEHATGYVS